MLSPVAVDQPALPPQSVNANLNALNAELDWLGHVIDCVIRQYLRHEGHATHWIELTPPAHDPGSSVYGELVRDWSLTVFERLALALALAPHLRPQVLDIFFGVNQLHNRSFTEFGGMTDKAFSGFLPTAQTLAFLIAANDPEWHAQVMDILAPANRLMAEQVLSLDRQDPSLPAISAQLCMAERWLQYLLTGEQVQPEFSASFPATSITTPLEWTDLVLDDIVMQQVQEIRTWLQYGHTLMDEWQLARKIKPGYRALFFGPPGTGKTLTATLLAKTSGREIYRVDLSMVVSKYIGETEKNLARVFDAASYKEWILFFDEADALFGKRTTATTSNDRHANQLTGYLLQRIEDFPGVVILASNLRANMDEAFTRRFQSMIHFNVPSADERVQLWRNAFNGTCKLAADIDLDGLAQQYELTGGSIINVLRYCAMSAIARGESIASADDVLNGIRRELRKENKTVSLVK
ncbi:MAG TPA: ATP-binding protein [Candidatus Acidoferrum sp.]|nr:ATP-binding protein [Candidatus Acidoferrum sp.]